MYKTMKENLILYKIWLNSTIKGTIVTENTKPNILCLNKKKRSKSFHSFLLKMLIFYLCHCKLLYYHEILLFCPIHWSPLSRDAVTWGPNPLSSSYFVRQPRTTADAVNQGFVKISDCDGKSKERTQVK